MYVSLVATVALLGYLHKLVVCGGIDEYLYVEILKGGAEYFPGLAIVLDISNAFIGFVLNVLLHSLKD